MIYEYRCDHCQKTYEVSKCVREMDCDEYCERGHRMDRVFCFRGQVSFGTFKPGFYSAFGKAFTNENQLKNEIRRLHGEEGKRVIEVGNEMKALKKLRPEKKGYNREAALHELRRTNG